MEETLYTKEQLIQFGYYILSQERTNLVKNNSKGNHKLKVERLKQVYDADITNFEYLFKVNK